MQCEPARAHKLHLVDRLAADVTLLVLRHKALAERRLPRWGLCAQEVRASKQGPQFKCSIPVPKPNESTEEEGGAFNGASRCRDHLDEVRFSAALDLDTVECALKQRDLCGIVLSLP